MILSTVIFASLFSFIYGCSSTANQTCMTVTLTDLYGDGWDGARLYVEFPDGTTGDSPLTLSSSSLSFV